MTDGKGDGREMYLKKMYLKEMYKNSQEIFYLDNLELGIWDFTLLDLEAIYSLQET